MKAYSSACALDEFEACAQGKDKEVVGMVGGRGLIS